MADTANVVEKLPADFAQPLFASRDGPPLAAWVSVVPAAKVRRPIWKVPQVPQNLGLILVG